MKEIAFLTSDEKLSELHLELLTPMGYTRVHHDELTASAGSLLVLVDSYKRIEDSYREMGYKTANIRTTKRGVKDKDLISILKVIKSLGDPVNLDKVVPTGSCLNVSIAKDLYELQFHHRPDYVCQDGYLYNTNVHSKVKLMFHELQLAVMFEYSIRPLATVKHMVSKTIDKLGYDEIVAIPGLISMVPNGGTWALNYVKDLHLPIILSARNKPLQRYYKSHGFKDINGTQLIYYPEG